MASMQQQPTVSDLTRENVDHHSKLAPGPSAYVPPSSSGSDRDADDDALVPSLPKRSAWDDAFYNSTPTPKPPPRLAPMPKSPSSVATARSPPPPLVITTRRNTSSPATPTLAPGDSLELLGKAKNRYPSAFHAHNRSLSHSQAHSNHGNNIFSVPSDSPQNAIATRGSPSLGSLSSIGTESSLGDFHLNLALDGTTPGTATGLGATRSYSSTTLSHASPAAVRSSFPLHHLQNNTSARQNHGQLPHQGYPQLHRHHPHQNPLLTPSSSQSNLFSNLPSPLTRTSLSSANIFRDPPPAPASSSFATASNHSGLSYVVSQKDISNSLLQDPAESDPSGTDDTTAAPIIVNSSAATAPPPSSSSSQRKIYPGLKNTVGPYKLLHSIGHGSFSEVKMAVDTRTGDHVAIKVMSRAMIQSSDRLGISVRRESDLLKSIQHPNIVGFREVVETSLQMCIVLDYASGGELFEFVADKRALASEQDIQYIFAQIVDAVDYLHQHNIVHRDLKLENVLLEPRTGAPLRPIVKLTDFGLAKVIEEDAPLLTTRCGSEDYAAPEIILGQPYDGREADIWSLGVLLYALLVGFLPFNMRPGMGRKSFLSMIAHAEFGFPGEKVSIKRASLLNLHQRSLSSASTGSSSSILTEQGTASAGTLLPAATPDTPSAAEEVLSTMVVPKMRGVSAVSDESKDLVRWLLQTLGSKRPTAQHLREHPWVVAGRQLVRESNSATIVNTRSSNSGKQ